MSMLKTKIFSPSLIWIVTSVFMFFIGLILAAMSSLMGDSQLGRFLWITGFLSMLVYVFYSAVLWFRFKKGSAFNNLVTAYIILSLLFTITGLVGAFLTYPDGLKVFLIGLGMMGGYWLIKIFHLVIFTKDSDFE